MVNLAPQELPEDQYVWSIQVALAWDCLWNALLGGWHHETLSSRAWRAWAMKKPMGRVFRPIIDTLFWWQKRDFNHCQRHHELEVARAEKIVRVRAGL